MMNKQVFFTLYNKNSPISPHRDIGHLDARLFLRAMSVHVAYFLGGQKVSANKITFLFISLGLLANSLVLSDSIWVLSIAVFLEELAQLFDCVDGQLARFHCTASDFGRIFDKTAHAVLGSTFLLVLGSKIYFFTENPLYLVLALVSGGFLTLISFQSGGTKIAAKGTPSVTGFWHSGINWFARQVVTVFDEPRFFAALVLLGTLLERLINLESGAVISGIFVAGVSIIALRVFFEKAYWPLRNFFAVSTR